ncbi:hypothetical protein HYT54_02635 [Candidatus Woesearchaeota archaeon]|nr:hypothetical protein [Candidatus Woesearchaeota archaeon]
MRKRTASLPLSFAVYILIALAMVFVIYGTVLGKEGLINRAAGAAHDTTKVLPGSGFGDSRSVSSKEAELKRLQDNFVSTLNIYIENARDKPECIMPYPSLKGLGGDRLEINRAGGQSVVLLQKIGGEGELEDGDVDIVQKINPLSLNGEICIVHAANFCAKYNLGEGCRGTDPGMLATSRHFSVPLIVDGEKLHLIDDEYDYNTNYLYKTGNSLCFILNHGSGWPIGCDADSNKNTLDDDCNDDLARVVGLCTYRAT